MTRLELVRRSGISRGTLRDLELGVHTPTRRILRKFIEFCQKHQVPETLLEDLRCLYAGSGETLGEVIARLQLRAGSPRELAQRVGLSPATLWEYQRGTFPLPLSLLRRLCQAVEVNPAHAEQLWHATERDRLLDKGYPPPLAEFWVLCSRKGWAEKHLAKKGVKSAVLRKLRYLEVPPWEDVEDIAGKVCCSGEELARLRELWRPEADSPAADDFGPRLRQHRKKRGMSRREVSDLFGIGGKKPARIIKYIEEDGFYSTRAFPAGLVALLVPNQREQAALLKAWRRRREVFHSRHRPEMRLDLRLVREMYGFSPADLEPVLGYSSSEYQRIERGVTPLRPSGLERIVQAIHQAGEKKVEQILARREQALTEREAWRSPESIAKLVEQLARREGGLLPLARLLKKSLVKGLSVDRLRRIAAGREVPPWCVLRQVSKAAGVADLVDVRDDWLGRFRRELRECCPSPLGVELRLLIAEVAETLRAFAPRLGFNYSVLVRNFQLIDNDQPIKWAYVERILVAAGLTRDDSRWLEIHALWYTAADRLRNRARNLPARSRNGSNGVDGKDERKQAGEMG
jgi:transcriptional regulator with XRE-family HTH domain